MKELSNHLGTIDLSRYAWCLNVWWKSHDSNGFSKLGREYLIFTSQLLHDFSHQQGHDQSEKPKRLWEKTAAIIGFTLRNNMYIHTNFIKLHQFHGIWNPKGSFFQVLFHPFAIFTSNGIEGWNHTPSLVLLSDTILLGLKNHEVSNAKHPSSVVLDVSFWLTSLNHHLYHPPKKTYSSPPEPMPWQIAKLKLWS